MIVYICYYDYDYEGYSEPKRVFTKEEDAVAWVKDTGTGYAGYEFMNVEKSYKKTKAKKSK